MDPISFNSAYSAQPVLSGPSPEEKFAQFKNAEDTFTSTLTDLKKGTIDVSKVADDFIAMQKAYKATGSYVPKSPFDAFYITIYKDFASSSIPKGKTLGALASETPPDMKGIKDTLNYLVSYAKKNS